MPNSPFKPPRTDVDDQDGAPGSPLRAVMTGLAVDIGGSLLADILLTIVYHSQLAASAQAGAALDDGIPMNSPVEMIGIVLGAACSVLGGYVCARIVRRNEFRVGGVMAILSASPGLLFASSSTPDDLVFLLTASTIACVMLGVKYGREHNRRGAPPAPPSGNLPRP